MNFFKKIFPEENISYLKSFLFISIILVLVEVLLASIVGLHHSYWHDEAHFVTTIRQFGNGISIKLLKHYNEMSTPLPFILYSFWGRLFGFGIATLRIFSLIIAFLTYLIFYQLAFTLLKNERAAILATLFLFIQPYLIGLSIFVFTDMLMILFLLLSVLAVIKSRPFLFLLAGAGGLLCRQYFAFVILASGLFYIFKLIQQKDKQSMIMLFSIFISMLPLFFLFFLWKGFSPQNNLKTLYLNKHLYFHPGFLVLYISLFVVYLFPVIIYRWRFIYGNIKILVSALIISSTYLFYPVHASEPAIAANIHTVGFFDRLVLRIFGSNVEQIVFYTAFLFSLPVVILILRDCYQRIKLTSFNYLLFLDLLIISFLILMPFSYLNWEKYFVPAIPLAILQILLLTKSDLGIKVEGGNFLSSLL